MSKFVNNRGARVKVYRNTQRGRQYCMLGTPSDIDEEVIRQFHAKQEFRSEEGHYEIALEIDGVLQEPFPVFISPQQAMSVDAIKSSESYGGMAEVLKLLAAQNERLERMVLGQERTPMVEMVDAMHKLDQMRGGGAQAMSVDNILKCVEIGQKLNSGGGQPFDFWQMLAETAKENAPAILQAIQRFQAAQPAHPSQPPQQITEQPKPEQSTMTTEEQDKLLLTGAIGFLKKKALAGADPELYIGLVCDNQEDAMYERLIYKITNSDFSTFAAIDPDIEKPQYRGFFCAIYDGIRSVFIPADKVASTTIREVGNTGNAPRNGTNGTGRRK